MEILVSVYIKIFESRWCLTISRISHDLSLSLCPSLKNALLPPPIWHPLVDLSPLTLLYFPAEHLLSSHAGLWAREVNCWLWYPQSLAHCWFLYDTQ